MINSWVQTIYIKNTGSCKVVVTDGKQDQGQLITNTLNNLTANPLREVVSNFRESGDRSEISTFFYLLKKSLLVNRFQK